MTADCTVDNPDRARALNFVTVISIFPPSAWADIIAAPSGWALQFQERAF
jgi:hypothetical protein